jgi:hypothetical protein
MQGTGGHWQAGHDHGIRARRRAVTVTMIVQVGLPGGEPATVTRARPGPLRLAAWQADSEPGDCQSWPGRTRRWTAGRVTWLEVTMALWRSSFTVTEFIWNLPGLNLADLRYLRSDLRYRYILILQVEPSISKVGKWPSISGYDITTRCRMFGIRYRMLKLEIW